MQNSCNARARVRARDTSTHIFHKRKHFIFHLPFLPSRSLLQKVREKVRQKRNYLGRFSKNVGDFLKNVGRFPKILRHYFNVLLHFQETIRPCTIAVGHYSCRPLQPLRDWACLQLRKITFALQNWRIYNLTSCLKAQKKRVCQNLTHPLS